MIFNLYKQRGETPLECIQRFAENNSKLKGEKMTYLGRLDPLAEGVLLMASGKDTTQKRREEFFSLDKEYDFTCVFGFATDTYDILGKITKVERLQELDYMNIKKVAIIYEGEREQKYPPFSSKIISRTTSPLASRPHRLAKYGGQARGPLPARLAMQGIAGRLVKEREEEGEKSQTTNLSEIAVPPPLIKGRGLGGEIPSKKIVIHKLQFDGLNILNSKEFFGQLLMNISKVKGNFRQDEILALWKEILFKYPDNKIFLGKFSAKVSSGTYIRGIVNDMGNTLGCGATTLSIKRTRVDKYKIEDSIK